MTRKLIPFLSALALLAHWPSVALAASPTNAKPSEKCKTTATRATTATAAGTSTGYEIEQRLEYEGLLKIQTSTKGTRVQTKDLLIFLDPNGQLPLAFNPANKKYCVFNKGLWQDKNHDRLPVKDIKAGRTIEWQGHKVTLHSGDSLTVKGQTRFHIEFWTANDFKVPQKVLDDYLRFLGLPAGYGFPIYMVRSYPDGRKERFLNTKSIKTAMFNIADLRPPTQNYTKVANEMEVVLGTSDDLNLSP